MIKTADFHVTVVRRNVAHVGLDDKDTVMSVRLVAVSFCISDIKKSQDGESCREIFIIGDTGNGNIVNKWYYKKKPQAGENCLLRTCSQL